MRPGWWGKRVVARFDEAEAMRFGERVLELVGRQLVGEVDQRPLHGVDADAPPEADLVGTQRSALVGGCRDDHCGSEEE